MPTDMVGQPCFNPALLAYLFLIWHYKYHYPVQGKFLVMFGKEG